MKLDFVAHAGFVIETGDRRILCDPWTEGKVFNNGWALISPAAPIDYSRIDYLWISHEHPDHLNFPTLRGIADADKKRIVLLHQRHASSRIVDALAQMGFSNIVELPLYRWRELSPGVKVYCGSVGSYDSFLAIKDAEACVLNMNDCVVNPAQMAYINRQVGPVDVLLTQYSFANWVGNDRDELDQAGKKIEQLRSQMQIVQPALTIPFASFVYFCNEENRRMNAWINTPERIQRLGLPGIAFMYPGDSWESGGPPPDSDRAVRRYMDDLRELHIDPTPESVPEEKLAKAIEKALASLRSAYPAFLLRRLPPFEVFVHDLDRIVRVDAGAGGYQIEEAGAARAAKARYVMCSQALWYAFQFEFGGDTLVISGMYRDREFAEKGKHPFFRFRSYQSTQLFRFDSPGAAVRTLTFFWRKRWEIFHRYVKGRGAPIPENGRRARSA